MTQAQLLRLVAAIVLGFIVLACLAWLGKMRVACHPVGTAHAMAYTCTCRPGWTGNTCNRQMQMGPEPFLLRPIVDVLKK